MTFKPKMVIYKPVDGGIVQENSSVFYDNRRKAWVIKWEGYKDTILYMDGTVKHDKRLKVIRT